MTAATPATSSYRGADVDGLDRLAQEFQQAAQVCDEVKAACEIIVAASFIFGPFGAAFVSYLKTVVIPWLTKISEALKLMAKVLSAHSHAQRDASSSATSLPSYSTPPSLPAGNTANYPVLPPAAGTGSGGTGAPTPAPVGAAGGSGSTSVTPPPSIGGTPPVGSTPIGSTPVGSSPIGSAPTGSSPIGSTPIGAGGGLGGLPPGVTATPLHPGDAVGYLTVPVEIGKDGTITPLLHTNAPNAPAAPAVPSTPAVPHPTPIHHAPPVHAVPHHPLHPAGHHVGTNESSALGSGGGSGGGSLGGGGLTSSSGAQPHGADAQFVSSTPATIGAHPAAAAAAAHGTAHAGGASHDGLYGGIGQATGIGAGAAALARATLHEARQRAENGLLGAVTLPFDADADTAVRATVLNGELQ